MRSLILFLMIVPLLGAFELGLIPTKISSTVTCFLGKPEVMNTTNNGNMVNSCYIATSQGYVVIDSGSSYAYAASAYKAMQITQELPVILVIDTHVHDDHWLGNGFFVAQGVRVLGSDDFAHNSSIASPTRIQTHISPQAYANTIPIRPIEMIDHDTNLTFGTTTLELHLIPMLAHSAKDMVIFVPQSKTLFAGDLVFNDRIPSLLGGDINGWIWALEQLKTYGATTIIGGHGVKTDAEAMTMTYGYLTRLRYEVRHALHAGWGIEETMKTVTMPEYKHLKMFETLHRSNVETAYRTLEWEQ
jgi:glyoxylase-like metal-dependent hydrolase (beta-lactamase superfamily II)